MCDLVLDNERRREVSDALGLSFGRIKALRRIAEAPMAMGELAAVLGIDAPYMTVIVDDLEEQGFVERKAHPRDCRAKLVVATRRGAHVARRAQDILGRPPAGFAGFQAEDVSDLVRILRTIRPRSAGHELLDEPSTSTP